MTLKETIDSLPAAVVAVLGAAAIGIASIGIGAALDAVLSPDTPAPSARHAPVETAVDEEAPVPEGPGPAAARVDDEPVVARRYMIVAAHPAAAQAGAKMLGDGGGAIDAAIAAQMVLNLVEPQSSGIGGGGFLLHWDDTKRRITTYDGRETAPLRSMPHFMATPDGEARPFRDRATGGQAVGIPGLLRMLALAHERHGRLPWADLFAPAIELAEAGFPVSPRLHALVERNQRGLAASPGARAYFFDSDGAPHSVGATLRNPALADTFRQIAEQGPIAFYEGEIAADIVRAVQDAFRNPGVMSRRDLAIYRPVIRDNLCGRYRAYLVCGMPPPSSGGLATLQMLGILDNFRLDRREPDSVEAIQLVAEAGRFAFADRNRYVGDPDFVTVPVREMTYRHYLAERAGLVDLGDGEKAPKEPGALLPEQAASAESPELPSTTHLSVVDAEGNAVAMTSSIERAFGSRLMVRGFLLNNQLTDFSWPERADGTPAANALAPGKRPRSSMAPTLVFDRSRELMMVTGSPGGSRIIGYTVQNLLNVLDWGMDPQQAVAFPHYLDRNSGVEVEAGTRLEALLPAIRARGYEAEAYPMTSGLHAIVIERNRLLGGVDPRREGAAVGEDQLDDDPDAAFGFIQAGAE